MSEHFVPQEIEFDEQELTQENDKFGFKRADIKDERSTCLKNVEELKKNWTPCFIIIKSILSPEIEARIKEMELGTRTRPRHTTHL